MNCRICGVKSHSDYCFKHKPKKQLKSGKIPSLSSKKLDNGGINHQKEEKKKQTELLHKKMFEWWKSFGNKKHCECCGFQLPNFFSTINVHHLLPKHKFPEIKLDKKYWMLLCEKCHCSWELSPFNKIIEARTIQAKKDYENN